jgi:hypothetical protein
MLPSADRPDFPALVPPLVMLPYRLITLCIVAFGSKLGSIERGKEDHSFQTGSGRVGKGISEPDQFDGVRSERQDSANEIR